MADLFQTGVLGGQGAKDLTVPDHANAFGPGTSTDYATGDLRRKYNFGDRVSELSIAQDPFFRLVSQVAKKPTDDPAFKWAEKRPSWNKRYAYVMGFKDSSGNSQFTEALITSSGNTNTGANIVAGDELTLFMAGDYLTDGNIANIYGNTTSAVTLGGSGTTPNFYLPGQVIKIPTMTAGQTSGASWGKSYMLVRLKEVVALHAGAAVDLKYPAEIKVEVVKASDSSYLDYAGWWDNDFSPGNADGDEVVSDRSIGSDATGNLEQARSYVVGTAHAEGSGYPETWKDQPYATNHGLTQIWKTSCAMTNTARATSLKYDESEWSRVWQQKLIEHKYDIETSLLFGSQHIDAQNDIQYTQGAVDYVSTYGNQFNLDVLTKTSDSFLDDMSNYFDPRYNNAGATVFMVSTAVYNWMHKLGGYFANNMGAVQPFTGGVSDTTASDSSKTLGRATSADIALVGKKKVLGVDVTTFSTPYGDMNIARNIHLDGTQVKMLGINLKNCSYRPLVGNGINRDTSVYVGVQTLENSGIDRRVDLILTEAGMEFSMPECHAIWT